MCINCMLCYAACPIYGLDPQFIGPAAIALAQRYNLDSRDEGARERLAVLSQHEGIWGCTFVGECTKVCPKNVDPAGAIQRYKLTAALESLKSFLLPWSADEGRPGLHAASPALAPASRLHLLVAERRSYLVVHPARAEQRLRRVGRRLSADAVQGGRGAPTRTGSFSRGPRTPSCWLERRQPAFAVFHAVTWFNLAPQAMVVHVAGRRLPRFLIAGVQLRGMGGRVGDPRLDAGR